MKKIVITGIVVAGLVFGGTSLVGASINDNDDTKMKDTVDVVETKDVDATKSLLSIEKVKEIVLSEYEGYIDNIDLEHDDGFAYFEVEIENGDAEYEIYIEAYTGEVISIEIDDDIEQKLLEKILSSDDAKKIAVAQVGGEVKEIDLDEDDHRIEYEIELRTQQGEVEIYEQELSNN